MAAEWFRRKTWSQEDEKQFFARLSRSRPFNRPQYLRLQAYELSQTREPLLANAALGLLDHLFSNFDDPYECMSAHDLAGKCHDQLGNVESATHHFRRALELKAEAPNRDCGTELTVACFIVKHRLADLHDEALAILDRAHLAFPLQTFRASAVRALISSSRKDRAAAARFAAEALQAASMQQSQFRYHRSIGLVGPEEADMIRQMQALAGQ